MSISTYAELSTAVAGWLHRTDMTAIIPDLIKMGEVTINRKLRLISMENVASLTNTTTDRFLTLPTGFIEAIDLSLYDSDYPQTLTQLPLSKINGRAQSVQAQPRFYAISTNIIFDAIPYQVYDCQLRYYKRLDIATDLTNSVLTNHPDIYLYSALMAAAPYVKNDERLTTWVQLLDDAIKSANKLDGRNRSSAMLTVEAGMRQRNVNNGDIVTGGA